jgi:DNA repair protein RecO (recombination protein O)
MATYSATGINVGSFNLGESDKIVTIFTAERGLVRAVAKGARKPGSKIAGRAEPLNVNKLLLSTGRSLDIISQAEGIETFPKLRSDLVRLSYALYYAELTQHFGPGLAEENEVYFDFLRDALRRQAEQDADPAWLGLRFEFGLLDLLGYRPELTYCIICRKPLMDASLGAFHQDWGGIVCKVCMNNGQNDLAQSGDNHSPSGFTIRTAREITPLVWRHLILAADEKIPGNHLSGKTAKPSIKQSLTAARRILQGYIEHRAGKHMKSLDLVADFEDL